MKRWGVKCTTKLLVHILRQPNYLNRTVNSKPEVCSADQAEAAIDKVHELLNAMPTVE